MELRTIEVLKVTLLSLFLLTEGTETELEKSLFDDLPNNGAYVSTSLENSVQSYELSSSVIPENDTRIAKRIGESDSLFDSMPNQGAIISADHIFESKPQKRGIIATDSDLNRAPNGELRFRIELERQTPTTQFKHPNFHRRQLPSVVNPVLSQSTKPSQFQNGIKVTPLSQSYGRPLLPPRAGKPGSTVIVYGKPAPSLRKADPPKYFHHYYPTRQETQHHFYSLPKQERGNFYEAQRERPIPIITGPSNSNSGYGPPTGNQNVDITTGTPPSSTFRPPTVATARPSTPLPPSSDDSCDYDYETLDCQRNAESRNFGSRAGHFGEPTSSYRVPDKDSRSYYNIRQQPTNSYGPPSYSPPLTSTQASIHPSYGPPLLPPRDEPLPIPPQPTSSSTTSISYQTIPVQVTQFVTVPQITVSSTSNDDEPDSGQRPQSPGRPETPSTTYGQPLGVSELQDSKSSPGRSGPLFTAEQIELLVGASRGLDNENFYEADPLLSLLGGGRRSNRVLGASNFANLNSGLNFQLSNGRTRLGNQPILLNPQQPIPVLRSLGGLTSGLRQDSQIATLLAQQQQQRFTGIRNSNLAFPGIGRPRNGPILTGGAVEAVGNILREQRLRSALAELNGRLRHEGRSSARARRSYRSLFLKGALLLSALTLLPTVATPLAAASSGISSPHFLLPLVSGRRKRSLSSSDDFVLAPFEFCKNKMETEGKNGNGTLFNDFLNCVTDTTEEDAEKDTNASLFDSMPFNGAIVPEEIRKDLLKVIPRSEILKNSECLQKQFCETLIEIRSLPNAEAFLVLYAKFGMDFESNPWIRRAVTAANSNNCPTFFCHEDYETN